jgi:hypothetical protein
MDLVVENKEEAKEIAKSISYKSELNMSSENRNNSRSIV